MGRNARKELSMKKAIAISIGAILLSSGLHAAVKEERITGYVSSIDSQARKVTLDDGAVFPLKPNADISWLQPGTKVDLFCDYDALGIVACGVGLPALSNDLNQGANDPLAGPGTGFANETGYQTPDALLPDKPTNNVLDLFRRRDK